jgi:glycosyltransferase involved in cell wall biosynthesis
MELHPGNARRFIFSGRINRKKNIAFALSVLSKMSVPVNVDFVIVGPIEDEQYAEEIYRLAKSAPNIRVRFLGVLNREDLFKELRQSDCFILPTLHENYGHSIVEAWANSCPVIISNQTPWENLKFTGVGWDVPLDEDRWKDAFFEFFQLDLHQRVKLSDRCRDFFQKEVYTELDNNANLTLFDL